MGIKQKSLKNMKNSGVYYIGSVPNNYEIIRYKYLSDVKMGNTILESETSTEMDNEHKIAVYSATQSEKIFGYVKETQDILKKGDIVIPARGNSIGCAKLVTKDDSTSTQTTIMSYNIRSVNNKYLFYCSWAFKDEWYRYDGSAIPQITVKQVENNILPLPNALLQDKIVSELDKKVNIIDELIKNQEQQIEQLKEYKQSLITEVVTKGLDKNVEMKDSGVEWIGKIPKDWEVIKLKYIATSNDESIAESEIDDRVIKYVDIGSVTFENGVEHIEEIKLKEAPSRARRITKEGDLIVSTVRTYLKAIATINESNIIASTGFCVIRNKSVINNKFLEYVCKSDFFTNIVSSQSIGVNYPSISSYQLMNLYIAMPEIKTQEKIVLFLNDKINKVEKIIKTKREKIETLYEYKKSLIYEYVTGKKEV